MKTIVFVCTGNTCRSPMAEGIMRQMLREYGIGDVNVTSCGLYVGDELREPPTGKAVRAVGSLYGVDISAHRTRALSEVIEQGDLFIGLTKGHANDLVTKHHLPADKVIAMDVDDPCGGDEMEYQEVAIDIHTYLLRHLKEICR